MELVKPEQIEELLRSTGRKGIDAVMEYLRNSDFYIAPASTKYHLSVIGGLAKHSLSVYECMSKLARLSPIEFAPDSIILTSVLHDVCKINYYGRENKNVKDPNTKQWSTEEVYVIKDKFPFGHGSKSVVILQNKGLVLTEEEMLAIRWHMGAWEMAPYETEIYRNASNKSKLVSLLHISDMMSTHLYEV